MEPKKTRGPRRFRKPSGMTILAAIAITVMGYLLVIPLVAQVITALRGPFLPFGVPSAKWGFENFETLLALNDDLWKTLGATALFVGGSTVMSVVLAWVLAWLVVRTNLAGKALISALVIVPYIIPPIVKAQAFYLMLSPESGILNQFLHLFPWVPAGSGPIDPFSFSSLIFIQALNSVTFPFLLFMPILANMDGGLEEAARVSGASWPQTLRRVTWPMLWPATLGVLMLTSIINLGSLEVPLLFGQQSGRDIFSLKLWNLIGSNTGELPQYGLAAAWGVQFLIITSVLFWLYLRSTRNAEQRASISGKGFRPTRLDLGKWVAPVWVFITVFLVVTAVMPLLALLWTSTTPFPLAFTIENLQQHASFAAYGEVLQDKEFWASLGRTVIIAGGSATLAVAVSTVVAYVVARSSRKGKYKALDLIASASVAIPATIAGFSSFILYLVMNQWVPISGTLMALVLAYAYRVSISYRTGFSATLQIRKELEEAAALSGASRLATFRRIVLPLLMPSMIAIWIQMFILGANEFTIPAFIATPESRPLSTYLYAMINPRSAQLYAPDRGAAMAMIFTLLVLIVGFVLQRVLNKRALAGGSEKRRNPKIDLATRSIAAQAAPVGEDAHLEEAPIGSLAEALAPGIGDREPEEESVGTPAP